MSYKNQKRVILVSFLFFPVLLMLAFMVWPSIRMLYFSFTDWDGVLPKFKFIGFDNYVRVLTEQRVWTSLKNNGAYALVGILQNAVSLFFAVLLNTKMRLKSFYKTTVFMPYVLNVTAIAYMFNFMYDFNEGPINMFIRAAGAEPVRFFSDANVAIFTLVSMSTWRWLGYSMVIYIAALQSVDHEIYESSAIDGANSWQTFRHITLPNIIRMVELQLFLSLNGSLQAFTETLILTKGGPGDATYTFMYYIIQAYSVFNSYGYAAAMSTILVIIIILVTSIQKLVISRGGRRA